MPRRDDAPIGAPCWVDLFTSDPDRSQAFYGELFGWTRRGAGAEFGGYVNFSKDGVRVAGGMRNDGSSGRARRAGRSTSRSRDAEATVDAAAASGSQVIVPAMAVGDLGTMAVVTDPGRRRDRHVAARPAQGLRRLRRAGRARRGSSCTRATTTRRSQFYRDVFKWDAHTDERLARVPLHDATARTTTALAGIMDAIGVPARRRPVELVGLLRRPTTPTRRSRRSPTSAARSSQPAEDTPYGRLATRRRPDRRAVQARARHVIAQIRHDRAIRSVRWRRRAARKERCA